MLFGEKQVRICLLGLLFSWFIINRCTMCFLEVYNFLFVVSDLINYICLRSKQNDAYKQVL